jgi:heat-inducible transcriptional repressor
VEDLTERQREILRIAVRQHIQTAHPIGSDAVCRACNLGVSAATIRSEFAALTDLGYLAQPHTSAGRVPTAKGYRYFVERLMEESELTPSQQLLIRHQFHQITQDPDEWMKLAASVLAKTAQSASLIAAPQSRRSRFRHLELISLSELSGLMILVLQDGSVHQQMMVFADAVLQEELSRLSYQLNDRLASQSTGDIRANQASEQNSQPSPLEVELLQRIWELMSAHEANAGRAIYRDGLMNILRQPEFEEVERVRQIVEVLEQDAALQAILGQADTHNGIQVIIGGEGKWDEIRDCSIVLSGYGMPGQGTGVLGVLGPMRMSYGTAIPTVRYVAHLMSDLILRLYGE